MLRNSQIPVFEEKRRRFRNLPNVWRRTWPLLIDDFGPKRYQKKREDMNYKLKMPIYPSHHNSNNIAAWSLSECSTSNSFILFLWHFQIKCGLKCISNLPQKKCFKNVRMKKIRSKTKMDNTNGLLKSSANN